MPAGSDTPRWQLESIYPGFDSAEYAAARAELRDLADRLGKVVSTPPSDKVDWLGKILQSLDRAYGLYGNLAGFVYCAYSVDTRNAAIIKELNALEEAALPLKDAEVRFRNVLSEMAAEIPGLLSANAELSQYAFFVNEQLELASKQMSVAEENLAADLMRPGGDAWGRLQDTLLSNLSWEWEDGERKTVVELRSLAMNPDRAVREKAYRKELEAWQSMEIPIAAALNGVKGFASILDKRRGYGSNLEHAARLSRVTPATVAALTGTIELNLPLFRRYLKAKARLIGVDRCAFFDLFAPVGSSERSFSFDEARQFIVAQFGGFSSELGTFADDACRLKWIDAEPRAGKTGGAYCQSMPLAEESRILLNFDGTFDSLFTMAHELGHGYHGLVLRGAPHLNREYPMTLAETASIFCETIVFNGAVESAEENERIGILETYLQGATQVTVDILSRFKFESAVFERRSGAELSAEEFSELMLEAQRATYGDGLDNELLHPYMWAVKPHYYSPDYSFYNYPYAFGLLFGLGLYSQYVDDPDGFPRRYRELLEMTGRATANEVTRQAGFDIESNEFWQSGIDRIGERIAEFERLIEAPGQ